MAAQTLAWWPKLLDPNTLSGEVLRAELHHHAAGPRGASGRRPLGPEGEQRRGRCAANKQATLGAGELSGCGRPSVAADQAVAAALHGRSDTLPAASARGRLLRALRQVPSHTPPQLRPPSAPSMPSSPGL